MAQELRWGLLSTARINRALIGPLALSKRNRLVGVASREAGKAAEYAREWQIPRAFDSYEALLADPEIDVVYISLPNSLHAEWTIRAAQAGKNVLCEKPLAVSVEEVDAIARAAEANGVAVAEAFMYRHHPQTLRVQEMVRSGKIGQVWLVRGSFSFKLTRPNDVRLRPELAGGSLWDVGCYPVSYTRALLGSEPERVEGWQVTGPSGVDLAFVGQMSFPGGVLAQIDSGFIGSSRRVMEIHGTEGSLVVPQPFIPRTGEVVLFRQGDREEELGMPDADPYREEVENMAAVVLDGAAPRVTLADSRANLTALAALYRAAQTGQPVHF